MGIFDKDKKDDGADRRDRDAQQLATLKKKYQSVLDAMYQHQVQVKSVQVEGGKLVIRGQAPSADAKNKIWDQIKKVDAAPLRPDRGHQRARRAWAAPRGRPPPRPREGPTPSRRATRSRRSASSTTVTPTSTCASSRPTGTS